MTATKQEIAAARRRLEDVLRKDILDLIRSGADPEDILIEIETLRAWWRDSISELWPDKYGQR